MVERARTLSTRQERSNKTETVLFTGDIHTAQHIGTAVDVVVSSRRRLYVFIFLLLCLRSAHRIGMVNYTCVSVSACLPVLVLVFVSEMYVCN